jgi:hypothetical protein
VGGGELNSTSKSHLHKLSCKDTFFSLVALLIMFVLLSSFVVSTFNGSPFVSGASPQNHDLDFETFIFTKERSSFT